MAYTPPDGDAAHFTWLDASAYTAPAGDAAHLAFAPDVPQATLLGVGLLGAPRIEAHANASGLLTGTGILGAPTLTANPRTVGWLTGTGILGAPRLLAAATGTQAHLQGPGLLGAPATTAWAGYRALLASDGLLGAPSLRANPRPLANLRGLGILGAPRQTAFIYPPAAAVLPAGVTTYHCRLTGAPDGLADLILPISSFSVRHKAGTDSSYQIAIPAIVYASGISARQQGQIVISQTAAGISEELLRGDLGDIRVDRGATSASLSISGNSARPPVTGATYVVTGCSYQYSTFAGENRLRIDPRAGIRPGNYLSYQGTRYAIGGVTWSVAVGAGSMNVTMEVELLDYSAGDPVPDTNFVYLRGSSLLGAPGLIADVTEEQGPELSPMPIDEEVYMTQQGSYPFSLVVAPGTYTLNLSAPDGQSSVMAVMAVQFGAPPDSTWECLKMAFPAAAQCVVSTAAQTTLYYNLYATAPPALVRLRVAKTA